MLKKYLTKKMGRVMVAAAMAAALVVPAGVQAGSATTGWKVVALNASTTAALYCDGQYMTHLTVRSSGSQAISSFSGAVRADYRVCAGQTSSKYNEKYCANATSGRVTYDYKGGAYGKLNVTK